MCKVCYFGVEPINNGEKEKLTGFSRAGLF